MNKLKLEFVSKTIRKILRSRKKLEKELGIKIEVRGNTVELKGGELDIFIGKKVLDALDKDFPANIALLLINEDYILEDILIKSIRHKNLSKTRARIIGTKGKTLKTLCELSSCYITLHDNTVSIIGKAENIKETMTAIETLIRGSRQTNIYSYLRKHKNKDIDDLGIKE